MRSFWQDLRYGLRLLRRQPGFALVATLVVGLGIGAHTTMFSLVDALAFKPRLGDTERVVRLFSRNREEAGRFRTFSFPNDDNLRAQKDVFATLAAHVPTMVGITEGTETRRSFIEIVSADFFSAFGVAPSLGRGFTEEEGRPRADIPVMTADLSSAGAGLPRQRHDPHDHERCFRGRRGADAARRAATAARVDDRLPVVTLETRPMFRERNLMLWVVRAGAWVFTAFGVVALAMAGLGIYGVKAYLVSRRTREIGIRMALGANPRQVVRLVMSDGLGLAIAGLVAGLGLSGLMSPAVGSLLFQGAGFDAPVVALAFVTLLAAASLASRLPARRATRIAPSSAVRNL